MSEETTADELYDLIWGIERRNIFRDIIRFTNNRLRSIPLSNVKITQAAIKMERKFRQTQAKAIYMDIIKTELEKKQTIEDVNLYFDAFYDIPDLLTPTTAFVNISGAPEVTNKPTEEQLVLIDSLEQIKADIEAKLLKMKNAKQFFNVLGPKETFEEIAKTTIASIWFTALRETGFISLSDRLMISILSTPCVLLALPLFHVQEIEVARSGKILKFRATGSVFLANQLGGEDAIRIEGFSYRSEIIWLLLLWALFHYGQGKMKEITGQIEGILGPDNKIDLLKLRKMGDIVNFNNTTTKPSCEFHETFPLVTKHIIIPNVYIETMSFEERIIDGLDVIKYSLLLRTYKRPTGFEVYRRKRTDYAAPKTESLKWYKVIEMGINYLWRAFNASGLYVDEREWRISKDAAGRDDIYYDFDPEDLVKMGALAVAGIGGVAKL